MTDEKFESYLREFEPKEPRPLPVAPSAYKKNPAGTQWKRLAAAAAIALVCGSSLLTAWRDKPLARTRKGGTSERLVADKSTEARKKTVFELTKAALEDTAAFEAAMEKDSRKILPRLEGPDSALGALANE